MQHSAAFQGVNKGHLSKATWSATAGAAHHAL